MAVRAWAFAWVAICLLVERVRGSAWVVRDSIWCAWVRGSICAVVTGCGCLCVHVGVCVGVT